MKSLFAMGIIATVAGFSIARGDDKPAAMAEERVELAKRIYRERILEGLHRRIAPPKSAVNQENEIFNETMAEDLHRWSLRWLDAELDAAKDKDKAGRVAAAQSHLDRMKSVESGKMIRKELADHPLVKELENQKHPLLEMDPEEIRKLGGELPASTRRYPDVTRYFRLEAEARVTTEKARD